MLCYPLLGLSETLPMNARWLLPAALVTVFSLSVFAHHVSAFGLLDRTDSDKKLLGEPSLMLWAWEYPCDLRFVNPKLTGVAFLAGKANLAGDTVLIKPRIQSLKIRPGTYMMAVVRIEVDRQKPPTFSDEQLQSLVSRTTQLLSIKPVQALQIDFDARQSERSFYRRFLEVLAKRMLPSMPISITSLASWSLRDSWIKDLACDEVVPMFFSMGSDRDRMISLLKSDYSGDNAADIKSIGLSVDEPDVLAVLPKLSRHIYLFSSKGWDNSRAITWVNSFESGGVRWQELAKH
jgi:hypothetical protein